MTLQPGDVADFYWNVDGRFIPVGTVKIIRRVNDDSDYYIVDSLRLFGGVPARSISEARSYLGDSYCSQWCLHVSVAHLLAPDEIE